MVKLGFSRQSSKLNIFFWTQNRESSHKSLIPVIFVYKCQTGLTDLGPSWGLSRVAPENNGSVCSSVPWQSCKPDTRNYLASLPTLGRSTTCTNLSHLENRGLALLSAGPNTSEGAIVWHHLAWETDMLLAFTGSKGIQDDRCIHMIYDRYGFKKCPC